jgi:D,D-heptose 1,7-bisphosphate phosphatase
VSAAAVFLDRDGTLVHEAGYIDRIDRLELFPWSVDAVRLLNRAGFRVVVVTNQAGVARGYFDEQFVRDAHAYLEGAEIAGFYHCPHHAEATVARYRVQCECRKPAPGLFRRAASELALDLPRCYGVGDRWHDVEAAQAAGATAIMVRSGYGATELARPKAGVLPAYVADTLIDATTWILRQRSC